MKKVRSVQFARTADGGYPSNLLTKESESTVLRENFSSWHSCGFYLDIYNLYKHYRTSRVPPWCGHTPPCHEMIHSGMVRGTWQIAQGSDLASELPRSQSNRAFTLEPAPRSHPTRLRGSPVNVLLTGSTGHTERSMSTFCRVRVWWAEGGGAPQEAGAWIQLLTKVDHQQEDARCRWHKRVRCQIRMGLKGHRVCSATRDYYRLQNLFL